jgi:hypothetical protein
MRRALSLLRRGVTTCEIKLDAAVGLEELVAPFTVAGQRRISTGLQRRIERILT